MDQKIINSKCACKKGLPWIRSRIVMILPCEHMIHYNCYIAHKTNNCPICDVRIDRIISLKKYNKSVNAIDDQRAIDMLSMTNFDSDTHIDYFGVSDNIVHLTSAISQIPLSRGIEDGMALCEQVLSLNNTTIKIIGGNKLASLNKKVFISNHSSYLDFIILFYVLKTGFLASSFVNGSTIGNQITKIVPCLIIDRGKKSNTVDKMKKFVDEYGSICLFPEGMITHPSTLIEFRTGAFNIGYPIYPIVITYDRTISDETVGGFILKLASKKDLHITIQILDPEYPPFDKLDISNIRLKMALAGNFLLSRVSNRDINDDDIKE